MAFHRIYTDTQLAEMQQRHIDGATLTEIAAELNRAPQSVYRLFKRHGLRTVHHGRKVEIFTPEVMRRAKDLYDQGKSIRQVALEMGLNPSSLMTAWRVHKMSTRARSAAARRRATWEASLLDVRMRFA